MLKTKQFLILCFLALPIASVAQDRVAIGPVEKLDNASSQITVLGQTFILTAATTFAANGRTIRPDFAAALIAPDHAVNIEGVDTPDGTFATSVAILTGSYTPGASVVYVRGSVAQKLSDLGQVRVGSLFVDTSTVAPELVATLGVGTTVEFTGIQPIPGGRVVGPVQMSIGGTGRQLLSIGGTGKQLQSIGGTGTQLQSIGGTGKQLQSIGGTGTQLQSIGGTGKQLQSIGGTGTQLQSIGGTGKQLQSIGGTGAQVQSIGGTGAQRLSIGGTGFQ